MRYNAAGYLKHDRYIYRAPQSSGLASSCACSRSCLFCLVLPVNLGACLSVSSVASLLFHCLQSASPSLPIQKLSTLGPSTDTANSCIACIQVSRGSTLLVRATPCIVHLVFVKNVGTCHACRYVWLILKRANRACLWSTRRVY